MSTQPTLSDEETAAHAARIQFLQQQAVNFMNQIRLVKISLLMADQNGELSQQLKEFLYNELLQCAGICETKERR